MTVPGESANRIDSVSATVVVYNGSDTPAADFLGFLATVPFDGDDPATARSWVAANISTGGTMEIGSARFTLSGPLGGRSLDIIAFGR